MTGAAPSVSASCSHRSLCAFSAARRSPNAAHSRLAVGAPPLGAAAMVGEGVGGVEPRVVGEGVVALLCARDAPGGVEDGRARWRERQEAHAERVGRAKYRRRVVLDGALLEVAPHVCSLVIVFVYSSMENVKGRRREHYMVHRDYNITCTGLFLLTHTCRVLRSFSRTLLPWRSSPPQQYSSTAVRLA